MDGETGVIHFKDWNNSYIPNILKELYLDQVYAPFLHGKENLTIFDLGFNIGLFSMYAAPFAKQIYGFEPTKETFDLATKNIKDNRLNNIKLIQAAISTEDKVSTDFFHYTNSTMNSLSGDILTKAQSTGNLSQTDSEKVQLMRLDTFVKQEGIKKIDFMKMDIEGEEGKVIGSQSFENITPILESLVVELHSWSGLNPQQLVTTLRDYGYYVEQIPSEATILSAIKK